MSVGGLTLGSVIIPGVAAQAPRGSEGAASAAKGPAEEGPAGERLARLRLVSPEELTGMGPGGQDASGQGLNGQGLNGQGASGQGLGGQDASGQGLNGQGIIRRGVNGRELDGPWGGRRLGRELAGWGGPDLRGGADLGSLGETELSRVEFAVVDLETTGWSPEVAAITEIAAVRVTGAGAVGWGSRHRVRRDGGAGRGEFVRLGEFASLVDPGVPVPPGIAELTGITDSMLAAAPRLRAVLPRLLEFSRGCVLVAHNAPFDLRFLVAGCGDCGVTWPGFTVLDTVMLARRVMDPDEVADCKLGTLAGFFGARTAPSHRALADARATADVLSWLVRRLEYRGIRTIQQLSAWPDVVA
jgi:DNA polymerase III epsilon subunit-like protein